MSLDGWKERELEDFIVDNHDQLFDLLLPFESPDYPLTTIQCGRQIPCKGGVIDLLYASWIDHPCTDVTIWVVELKAEHATAKTVEQVERYCRAVKSVDIHDGLTREEFWRFGHHMEDCIRVVPVIIAPSFNDGLRYFLYRVAAEKVDDGFDLSLQKRRAYAPYDNAALRDSLHMALRRARQSASGIEVGERLSRNTLAWGEVRGKR